MYTALMILLSISVVGQVVESWIVFRKMKSVLHGYLFFSCIATIVSSTGYMLELGAKTEEVYLTALKFSYIGRVWLCFMLFLFIAGLCRIRIPILLKTVIGIIHCFIYLSIFTTEHHELYYKNCDFTISNDMPKYIHDSGILHDVYTVILIVMSISALVMLFISLHKERSKTARKRYLMVILAIFAESIFLVVQLLRLIPFTHIIDLTIICYPIITLFMSVAILKFGLLDTEEMAREYMTDRLSEGIIAVDRNGRVRYFNGPAKKMYPHLHTRTGTVPPEITSALEKHENITVGGRIYSPERNELVKDGESCGWIYALVDETEHYRYMEELEKQKKIADNANQAKSVFLANMSHDIRTPINAVLGMNEMILRECDDDNILSYSDKIDSAGNTLLGLINDILDLSKIEAGKLDIIPVEYDLTSLLNDLVNMIQLRAEAKNLEFTTRINEDIPKELYGDEIRLKQIITNILTNAVKYTEKGKVTLSVSFDKISDDSITLNVSVSDTGIGIRQEDIPRLFSEFDRIEEERNRGIEGTGLGLNITQRLLSMMNSSLRAESEYGKGSVFSFEVRQKVIKWEPLGDIEKALRYSASERKKYRERFTAPDAEILVIDDTPMNLEVLSGLLKKTLIKIDTASSGDEGIELSLKKKYDIIFLDHMMPVKDGIQTLREMKAIPDSINADTPVICLTANAVSGSKEMYMEAGFDGYLTKPIVPRKLEDTLMDMLPKEKIKAASDKCDTDSDTQIPDPVKNISEINIGRGIMNCGGKEAYIKVLTAYAGSVADQCDDIEALWSSGDTDNLTIKVHALKSTSRVIGAEDIGSLAEKLETAGHSGNTAIISEGIGELLTKCRKLGQQLLPLIKKNDLPLIPMDELNEAYTLISEFISVEDYGSTIGIIDNLKDYSYPEQEKSKCGALIKAAQEYDYETISKIIQ